MATRIAWLLNLDAELELAAPRHYRVDGAMEARISSLRPKLSRLLLPDDVIIGRDPAVEMLRALAFCPTPSALARIADAGLTPPRAPPLALLARVNSRAFCAELGQTLPGARYVHDDDELARTIAEDPARDWLLKRPLSFAGRERRRVSGGALDRPTRGFVERSFRRGEGLQVEPLVARSADFAQHGYVLTGGGLLLGAPVAQRCDARGAWLSTHELAPGELFATERDALQKSAREAGEALARLGYFGPFGVDAYRYVEDGREHFQPRSEINARFSMGYPRALLEQALAFEDRATLPQL